MWNSTKTKIPPIYSQANKDLRLVDRMYYEWVMSMVLQSAKEVTKRRLYYDAQQPSRLNQDQINYLNSNDLKDNMCKMVVDLPSNRTGIKSWISSDEPTMKLANTIFEANQNSGSNQRTVYRNAYRDDKSYILVDYSPVKLPVYHTDGISSTNVRWSVINKAWCETTSIDDSSVDNVYGCTLHKTHSGMIDFASIRWQANDIASSSDVSGERLSLYYNDKIEHYTKKAGVVTKYQNAAWVPLEVMNAKGEMVWPVPWVDASGNPLGVPVFEFESPGGSRLTDGIMSMQDMLNDIVADVAGNARFNGFGLAYIAGEPDYQQSVVLSPAVLLKLTNPQAKVGRLEGVSSSSLLDVTAAFTESIGRQADIPPYLLRAWGKTPPSGISLHAQESGLIEFVNSAIEVFTHTWNQVMAMSITLERLFGENNQLKPDSVASPVWKEPFTLTVDEMDKEFDLKIKMGVPPEVLAVEIGGYTPEQVESWAEESPDQSETDNQESNNDSLDENTESDEEKS
ncbi:MAG: hypothetical protein GY928_34110 [Colwellia sp.]|nr:hypothetical protein [Colwellia sp.]